MPGVRFDQPRHEQRPSTVDYPCIVARQGRRTGANDLGDAIAAHQHFAGELCAAGAIENGDIRKEDVHGLLAEGAVRIGVGSI
jgi:hypothetical protein